MSFSFYHSKKRSSGSRDTCYSSYRWMAWGPGFARKWLSKNKTKQNKALVERKQGWEKACNCWRQVMAFGGSLYCSFTLGYIKYLIIQSLIDLSFLTYMLRFSFWGALSICTLFRGLNMKKTSWWGSPRVSWAVRVGKWAWTGPAWGGGHGDRFSRSRALACYIPPCCCLVGLLA